MQEYGQRIWPLGTLDSKGTEGQVNKTVLNDRIIFTEIY